MKFVFDEAGVFETRYLTARKMYCSLIITKLSLYTQYIYMQELNSFKWLHFHTRRTFISVTKNTNCEKYVTFHLNFNKKLAKLKWWGCPLCCFPPWAGRGGPRPPPGTRSSASAPAPRSPSPTGGTPSHHTHHHHHHHHYQHHHHQHQHLVYPQLPEYSE